MFFLMFMVGRECLDVFWFVVCCYSGKCCVWLWLLGIRCCSYCFCLLVVVFSCESGVRCSWLVFGCS